MPPQAPPSRSEETVSQPCRLGPVTHGSYRRAMETAPAELLAAARTARDRMESLARATARANTRGAGGDGQRTMAAAAREAIFADALLAAVHARFEELKAASK